jgi:hypothetical protein
MIEKDFNLNTSLPQRHKGHKESFFKDLKIAHGIRTLTEIFKVLFQCEFHFCAPKLFNWLNSDAIFYFSVRHFSVICRFGQNLLALLQQFF